MGLRLCNPDSLACPSAARWWVQRDLPRRSDVLYGGPMRASCSPRQRQCRSLGPAVWRARPRDARPSALRLAEPSYTVDLSNGRPAAAGWPDVPRETSPLLNPAAGVDLDQGARLAATLSLAPRTSRNGQSYQLESRPDVAHRSWLASPRIPSRPGFPLPGGASRGAFTLASATTADFATPLPGAANSGACTRASAMPTDSATPLPAAAIPDPFTRSWPLSHASRRLAEAAPPELLPADRLPASVLPETGCSSACPSVRGPNGSRNPSARGVLPGMFHVEHRRRLP